MPNDVGLLDRPTGPPVLHRVLRGLICQFRLWQGSTAAGSRACTSAPRQRACTCAAASQHVQLSSAARQARLSAHSRPSGVAAHRAAGRQSSECGCLYCSGCSSEAVSVCNDSSDDWSKGSCSGADASEQHRKGGHPLGKGRHWVARHWLQQRTCPSCQPQGPRRSNRHLSALGQLLCAVGCHQTAEQPAGSVAHRMCIVVEEHSLQNEGHLAGPLQRV